MSDSVWIEQPCQEQMKRTYYYKDGSYLTKEGGTVAWRNNNEGNLRPGSLSSKRIGVDKKNFAVFATPEDGHLAKKNLLFSSSSYKNLSLKEAIKKYAPSSDNNNPAKYSSFIMTNANVSNKTMSKYTSDEQDRIMKSMKIQEGYKAGTETHGSTSKKQEQNTNKSSKVDYKFNVDSAVKYNKNRPYSVSQWKSIQSKLNSETNSSLATDGIPGKLTASAVYKLQDKKSMSLKDGKFGDKTASALGVSKSKESKPQVKQSGKSVSIPSASKIMSTSYTPDLDLLNRHALQNGYDVKTVSTSANYVAKYCTGSSSQHQCTRGTSLFLQLASYSRGEADSKYKSSCAAHLFGSDNALTNYNISSSVANEYIMKSGKNKTGKSNMNTHISQNLKKDGEFVTFKYANSQHIVFRSGGNWYSDFKQGTAAGCGNQSTKYSKVNFFTL